MRSVPGARTLGAMPMSYPCRACGKRVRVSRKAQGQWGTCPHCRVEALVPTLTDSRVSETEESGERAALSNTMANTAAPQAVQTAPDPLEVERINLEMARARLELERAELMRDHARARPLREEPEEFEDEETECRACAETIKSRAKVCKHCGHVKGDRVPAPKSRKARTRRLGPARPGQTAAVIITVLLGPAFGWTYASGCAWGSLGLGVNMLIGVVAAAAGSAGLAVVLVANVLCAVHAAQMCDWN